MKNKILSIDSIDSIGIKAEANERGQTEITLLGTYEHPEHLGSSDWRITLYELNGYRVADTNGDPVWEEQDHAIFSELLADYGVTA